MLHGALLAALLLLGSVPALADLTIKVQKGGEAPYLYAYTGSGDGATKYTGNWPGTQFTEKDGAYWTMTIAGVNQVNIILNMGENGPQTADYLNLSGIDGVISLMYDGNTTMFGTMPAYAFSASEVYFAVPPSWGTTYAIARSEGGGYEQKTMEEIGTDGMGLRILKTSFSHWNDTPNTIEFHDNTTNSSGQLAYVAGGYYNTSKTVAQFMGLTASAFPDENFRNAIKASTGMSSDVFTPSSITYLDVSNQGISSIKGIELFTNLQTLLAARNNLTFANLKENKNLEVLDLSHNQSLSATYTDASQVTGQGRIFIRDCTGLTELYLNDCNFNAIGAATLTNLDKLVVSNNPKLDFVTSLNSCTRLRHLEIANCGITAANDALGSTKFGALTQLRYLDASDNPSLDFVYLTNKSQLETLILNKNTKLQTATATVLPGLDDLANLKHVEFNGVDLSTNNFIGTETSAGRLTASRDSLEYLDISNDLCVTPDIYGYTALQTIKVGNNHNITSLKIDNCTSLQEVDMTGNTAMKTLTLNNDNLSDSNIPTLTGLSGCTALTSLNMSNNLLTCVPSLDLPTSCTSLYINSNQLTSIAVPTGSPVKFLYAQDNNFPAAMQLTAESTGSLKGLDLGNNGITSFKAEGTGLSALMVGNNPQLTTLELHGNDNLTVTTAGTTMSDGSGLYLLGNTALETIDLSNSSFTGIGQNGSLAGLSAVKTLNGSHNAFTLFSNGTRIAETNNYHYTDPETGQQMTVNLAAVPAHPDLPNLDDLTGLEWLDMSYNQIDSIHLYKQVGLKYLDLQHNGYDRGTDTRTENPNQQQVYRKGLMKFDAHNLTALEYLNVSDCRIQETAIDRISETTHIDGTKLSGGYVWIKHCVNLKEFYADNNGMRSFGIKDNKALLKASARYMYGQSPEMMKGSINIHNTGVEGGSNLEYFDVSHSMFDSIGVSVATKLKVLKVEDNPIHYLYLNKNKALEEVYASDCTLAARHGLTAPSVDGCENTPISGLLQVRAEGLPVLQKLDLNGNTELKNLYCENDPILPEITGLPSCTDLRVLHAYNDVALGENIERFDVDANTALTTLWVSNCSLPGELRVSQCAQMDTLRCDTNRLTKLDVSSLSGIHWLDCFDNVAIQELVPGTSTGMTHLDLHNCSTIDLELSGNTALQYLDCDNNRIRELNLAGATQIGTIHANDNNLFQIKMGSSHQSLADLQFKNNHINAIDLSGCVANVLTNIEDQNNGRTIRANVAHVTTKDANNQTVTRKLYYFQLDANTEDHGGGDFMASQYCDEDESAMTEGYKRVLGRSQTSNTEAKTLTEDGMVLNRITWNEPPFVGTRTLRSRASDFGLTAENADEVIGTIVVLENTSGSDDLGSGTEEYKYNNGISNSTFYLNWTADGNIITGLDDLANDNSLTVSGGEGSLTVTCQQAMPLTVIDLSGRVIAQRDIDAGTTVIDGLAAGVYVVAGQKVVVK